MASFKCFRCHKKSGYSKRQGSTLMEMVTLDLDLSETRTYACEKCDVDNEITKTKDEWSAIDASR